MSSAVGRKRPRVTPRTCPTCGVTFKPPRNRVTFCSKRCKTLDQHGTPFCDYRGSAASGGECHHCLRVVSQLSGRGLCFPCYRDPDIRPLYPRTRTGPDLLPISARPCLYCRKEFVPPYRHLHCCSEECKNKARAGQRLLPTNGVAVSVRNALVVESRHVAEMWAARLYKSTWYVREYGELDDVKQLGFESLIYLIERHDPARHPEMKWYLFHGVRDRIRSECYRASRKKYRPDFALLRRRCFDRNQSPKVA